MSRKTKSLSAEANEAAREVARAVLGERFGCSTGNFADALGVSAPYLSEFLRGRRGAGMKILEGLSRVTGLPIEQIVGGDAPPTRPPPDPPVADHIEALARAWHPECERVDLTSYAGKDPESGQILRRVGVSLIDADGGELCEVELAAVPGGHHAALLALCEELRRRVQERVEAGTQALEVTRG